MIQPQLPFPNAPAQPPGRLRSSNGIHDFRSSLAWSERHVDAPWLFASYKAAFPTLVSSVSVREDSWGQRAGVDRVLSLGCGRTITLDEKFRSSDRSDVFLEVWSDEERRVPGWIEKPLAVDAIAYIFVPSRRCFIFPLPLLQRTWRLNGRGWIERHGQRRVRNRGYTSVGVPVPIGELQAAIGAATFVDTDLDHDGYAQPIDRRFLR